jgi:hypothetical protein
MKYNIQACWRCDVMWRYRLPTYTVSRLDCANNSFFFVGRCWLLLLLLLPTACRPVFFFFLLGRARLIELE